MNTNNKLNEEVFKKGTELAKNSIIYGVPIDELSVCELKAVAALGWAACMEQTMRTFNPFD